MWSLFFGSYLKMYETIAVSDWFLFLYIIKSERLPQGPIQQKVAYLTYISLSEPINFEPAYKGE